MENIDNDSGVSSSLVIGVVLFGIFSVFQSDGFVRRTGLSLFRILVFYFLAAIIVCSCIIIAVKGFEYFQIYCLFIQCVQRCKREGKKGENLEKYRWT